MLPFQIVYRIHHDGKVCVYLKNIEKLIALRRRLQIITS